MNNNNHLIIMAGGVGRRFWPMSVPEMPKQFIDILGMEKTLLQQTVDRFAKLIPLENVWVVTSKCYKDIVFRQLNGICSTHVLLEPCIRNTAPCIAYVAFKIKKKHPNANLVFTPADHIVFDEEKFRETILRGLEFTTNFNSIVTLGMEPTRPETGYGYIKACKENTTIKKVEVFKEKPCLQAAKEYLANGNYFWNAGIFIWNINTVVREYKTHAPDLLERFERLTPVYYSEQEQDVIDVEFPLCQSVSIDYAIMEKSQHVYMLPANFGWSDLGTWGSLYMYLDKDFNGNAVVGDDVKLVDCKDCVIHVSEERKVILQGLENCIIVEKDNRLLVCRQEAEQLIKEWLN